MTTYRFDRTLGVVTHVPHWDGGLAYEPYVREMEVWARLFRRIEVLAPRAEGPERGNLARYRAPNIHWRPVDYSMRVGDGGKLARLGQLPGLLRALRLLVRDVDLVLLRSPGHPAMLGRVVAALGRRRTITKWAGLFGGFEGERLPSRLERLQVLAGSGPTLVYGPAQRRHLESFIPAAMSRLELERADRLARDKHFRPPWRLLSVGRLSAVKGFDLALRGLAELQRIAPELDWRYTLVGGGPDADDLRVLAARAGIGERVAFTGPLQFEDAQRHYAEAHVVIMPGVKEGWPKPVIEAWAHHAVPVAAAAGLVPWILDGVGAGVAFDPVPAALGEALAGLLRDPGRMEAMAESGRLRSHDLSLEAFESGLERVLVERCGLP